MKKLTILASFLLLCFTLSASDKDTIKTKLSFGKDTVFIKQEKTFTINLEKQQLMYKVPISVIKECKDNLINLVEHIETNCDLTKYSTQKRLKRAKKQIKLLELNYLV